MLIEADAAPRGNVCKRDLQLVQGWVEKGYYRMNKKELAAAFARDWNYAPGHHKGSTLSRRARKLGLQSALKMGRPESRPFKG